MNGAFIDLQATLLGLQQLRDQKLIDDVVALEYQRRLLDRLIRP
ncbi:hypothetical protein ACFQ3P_25805 [Paraburkholderia sabiae]|uniref:Uncharacterized protein n=1 Tax=Paraburkholderia sabiae TaxID=273251 RepID=A0ABU9QLS9_9BURK|nr:hypothetical protein [Paraburkholderia sabiae]